MRRIVSWDCTGLVWWKVDGLTDGDAQAVEADEVLALVAAGDLGAVAASVLGGLGVDLDLLVAVRGTALGSGEGNSGHGGDEEGLEESHFDDWWFWWKGLGSECGIVDWIDCWMMRRS